MNRLRGLSAVLTSSLAIGLAAPGALAADAPLIAAPAVVEAKPPVPIDLAFGVRVQSDYNFRGISQSNRKPSLQGYGEVQLFDNFFYFGIAGYDVDLPTKADAEVDLTIGIRPKLGPLTFDFGLIYYGYPDERRFLNPFAPATYTLPNGDAFLAPAILTPRNSDFPELAAKVAWAIDDRWTVGAGVFHASDWLGLDAPATYVNGTVKYALPEGLVGPGVLAFSGELGHYQLGRVAGRLGGFKLEDYTYWNAGVAYTYKNATLDLRYHDTNLTKQECFTNTTDPRGVLFNAATGLAGRSRWCDAAFVATLSFDFTASGLGIFAPAAPPAPPKEALAGGQQAK